MKERDIRNGIREFIREFDRRMGQAVKNVMIPATLGVGLALSPACTSNDDPGQTRPPATRGAKADTADGGMVALYAAPFPAADSCQDRCGDQAPSGCWCDDQCATYGDCCDDKATLCDAPDGGMVALYAAPFPADAGVPEPQPEYAAPFPDNASCVGHCGDKAPSGCWCDDKCATYGDCCEDKAAACDQGPVALYAAPFPEPDAGVPEPQPEYAAPFPDNASCVGHCDGQAPSGCWCDDKCASYGDCCDDKAAACDQGPVALYAAPFPADAGS